MLRFIIKHINRKISAFIFVFLLFPIMLSAAESEGFASNRSVSYALSDELDLPTKQKLFRQTVTKNFAALQKQGFRKETASAEKNLTNISLSASVDYSIYSVTTDLFNDLDFDGFYHQFSVSIDVDTLYNSASVYAILYLSYEGGPWNEYASSDTFIINGDSSLDTFVIETELTEGYPAGYYDIRIELYDALTDEWLFNYGPYENPALSALPFEDSDNDGSAINELHGIETDIIITRAGGVMAGWLLWVFVVLIVARSFGATLRKN